MLELAYQQFEVLGSDPSCFECAPDAVKYASQFLGGKLQGMVDAVKHPPENLLPGGPNAVTCCEFAKGDGVIVGGEVGGRGWEQSMYAMQEHPQCMA